MNGYSSDVSPQGKESANRRRLFAVIAIVGTLWWPATARTAEPEKLISRDCQITPEDNNRAVAAFQKVYRVLQHPRCANCHGKLDVFSPEAKDTHGVDMDAGTQRVGEKTGFGNEENQWKGCQNCHTRAGQLYKTSRDPEIADDVFASQESRLGRWRQPAADERSYWGTLSLEQTCRAIKDRRKTGTAMIHHVRNDVLVKLGFEGKRGQDDLTPQPPTVGNPPRKISQAQFVSWVEEWMVAMKALHAQTDDEWPRDPDCGCVKDLAPKDAGAEACKSIPNSTFDGHRDGKPQCVCAGGLFFNKNKTMCLTKEEREREGSANCAGKYPDSVFTWIDGITPKCTCPEGRNWNRANTGCISREARHSEDSAFCTSKYPNSVSGGYRNDELQCVCPPDSSWNESQYACVAQEDSGSSSANADCAAKYPNSVYRKKKSSCGCSKGWMWNDTNTACVEKSSVAAAILAPLLEGAVKSQQQNQQQNQQRHQQQKQKANTASSRNECIECVNRLITGSCYVRIPKLAGWGLCLSCVPDGGVEPHNRFVDRDHCPVCQKSGWKLEDFKSYKYN